MTRNELILKIQQVRPDNDKEFREIISAVLDGGFLTENELADEVSASLPTIRRWGSKANAPHSLMRPHVFRCLLKKLEEQQ